MYEIFHENLEEELEFHYPCSENNLAAEVKSVSTHLGTRPTLLDLPWFNDPFDRICNEKMSLLLDPSLDCVEKVRRETTVHNCGSETHNAMKRFPALEEKIDLEVTKMVNRMETVISMVNHAINIETAHINKKHPDFHKKKLIEKTFSTSCGNQFVTWRTTRNRQCWRDW